MEEVSKNDLDIQNKRTFVPFSQTKLSRPSEVQGLTENGKPGLLLPRAKV